MNERSRCEYCKGNTKIDDYGNCKACGAPKPFYDNKPRHYDPLNQYGTINWRVGTDDTKWPVQATVCLSTSAW